jgi:hypothetical protein
VGPNLAVVVAAADPSLAAVVGPRPVVAVPSLAVAAVAPNLLAAGVLLLPGCHSSGRTWRLVRADFHNKHTRCSAEHHTLRKTAGHS